MIPNVFEKLVTESQALDRAISGDELSLNDGIKLMEDDIKKESTRNYFLTRFEDVGKASDIDLRLHFQEKK